MGREEMTKIDCLVGEPFAVKVLGIPSKSLFLTVTHLTNEIKFFSQKAGGSYISYLTVRTTGLRGCGNSNDETFTIERPSPNGRIQELLNYFLDRDIARRLYGHQHGIFSTVASKYVHMDIDELSFEGQIVQGGDTSRTSTALQGAFQQMERSRA